MKTNTHLAEIALLIETMKNFDSLKGHAESLQGPRTRGSTTSIGIDQLVAGGYDWIGDEFEPEVGAIPGCRYIKFEVPAYMQAELGAVSLEYLSARLHEVRLREGAHGYELFLDVPVEEAVTVPTSIITVILGPDETGSLPEVVWTWHPGLPLASASRGINPHVAVKVHNG